MFTVNYDKGLIKSDEIDFKLADVTWIDTVLFPPSLPNIEHLEYYDDAAGKMHVAITRRDQNPISGFGEIGTVKIVAEEIFVGLDQDTTTVITFSDVKMISHDMSIVPIFQDSFPLVITTDTSLANTTSIEFVDQPILEVYPNPSTEYIVVESSKATMTYLTLYDLLGRVYPVRQEVEFSNKRIVYFEEKMPKGIYFIVVETGKGILTKKIIIP